MDKELSWIFRDSTVTERLLDTLRSLTKLPVEPGGKSAFLGVKGEYISGSAVTALSRLAWWKLRMARTGTRNQTSQTPQTGQHTDQDAVKVLLPKLAEWAEVTENLMRVLQENAKVMQQGGHASAFASNPSDLWRRGLQELVAQQARSPMVDAEDADLELAISLLEVFTSFASEKSRASSSHVLSSTTEPAHAHGQLALLTFLREHSNLIWDEDAFRRVMSGRAEVWTRLQELDRGRGWSEAMFSYASEVGLSELDEQIVVHAEMRMMGLDFDNVREVVIE